VDRGLIFCRRPAGRVNGKIVQAPLFVSGSYVISCRERQACFTVSFRPEGYHEGLGSYETLAEAADVARYHALGATLHPAPLWRST
jgi:hypothetical protein